MKKRKIVYLAGLAMAGTLALTGCKKNTTDEPVRVIQVVDKPAPQIFQPHKHIYIQRKVYDVSSYSKFLEYINEQNTQIEVPEGYGKDEVEYIVDRNSIGSPKKIVIEIWFTNLEPVEAEAVYNPIEEKYEYSQPGKVIELETELETENNAKTLK